MHARIRDSKSTEELTVFVVQEAQLGWNELVYSDGWPVVRRSG